MESLKQLYLKQFNNNINNCDFKMIIKKMISEHKVEVSHFDYNYYAKKNYQTSFVDKLPTEYDLIDHMIKHGQYDNSDLYCVKNNGSNRLIIDKNTYYNDIADIVDWEQYLLDYKDVIESNIVTKEGAINHILEFGVNNHCIIYTYFEKIEYIHCFKKKLYEKYVNIIFNNDTSAYIHWYNNCTEPLFHPYMKINNEINVFNDKNIQTIFCNELLKIINQYCSLDEFLLYELDYFDSTVDIIDETLIEVYDNIDHFSNFITPYKNILFICSDFPGYGGAATNCENISNFYSQNHDVYSIYWNWDFEKIKKIETTDTYTIINKKDLFSTIKNLSFKPDIIILKSPCVYNLKEFYNCPIVNLIPGIYTNNLDISYTLLDSLSDQNQYINDFGISQIKTCDYSFTNSTHVKKILKKWYNLDVGLFCSSFISHHNTPIPICNNFNKRKYKYGLIVSDFSRCIKNVEKSIEFLKLQDKHDVILIGNGSTKYMHLGFKCIGLVNREKMKLYYQQIRHIVHDSHFESCSNVLIESIFNGCRKPITILPFELNKTYYLKSNNYYILGNITTIYDNTYSLFKINQINGFMIDNYDMKEIGFLIHSNTPITINTSDVSYSSIKNEFIGYNENYYSDSYKIDLYYYYGSLSIPISFLGLKNYYSEYLYNKSRKYNKALYLLILSYHCGKIKHATYRMFITTRLKQDLFHNKSIVLISKLINGYGGVQKTSMQLVELLDNYYNVDIISCCLNKNKIYNFQINRLNEDIPGCFIIKKTHIGEIENHINETNYEFIVNNKLNEALKWRLNQKMIALCHNSMDPFNTEILKYQDKLSKLFVINQFHKNLLISHNFKPPIYLYNNHVFEKEVKYDHIKTEFTYKIAFIGRITNDKNVRELINGVNEYNKVHEKKITLFIIGDGNNDFQNINTYIQPLGRLPFFRIEKIYNDIDYVISASITEGKPFAIVEALSRGIPCIHSNINGLNEIITDNKNGFLFDYADSTYNEIKFNLHFKNLPKIFNDNNKYNIQKVLERAYNISIDEWNQMSNDCKIFANFRFEKKYCEDRNMLFFRNITTNPTIKMKLFVNFKPDETVAYGGGNISVYYLIQNICDAYSDFTLTYELEPNIDIYLIIDPFKDNKFKKYSLNDVVAFKTEHGGKIIIRVNDCDRTRTIENNSRSREYQILQNYSHIDFFIFNSNYIQQYYFQKMIDSKISKKIFSQVIINGCDQTIFQSKEKIINDTIKIVTHHWSNNMHKGYQLYFDLWKYTKNHKTDIEFTFIGKNVPDMFSNVPISGPFVRSELSDELNKYHIYITDSRYDSCPNHVIEAISCGLPILCSNEEGGARELCTMSKYKIGELFESFEDLLVKINKIRNNYSFYTNNIKKSFHLFDANYSTSKYYNSLLRLRGEKYTRINAPFVNTIVHIKSNDNIGYLLLNDDKSFNLVKGSNIFAINTNIYHKIYVSNLNGEYTVNEFHKYKVDNKNVNVLLCSDSNYFVGLFAALTSVVQNTHYIDSTHFNFMIPIEQKNRFSNMLMEFENKIHQELDKTIFYIDAHILDSTLFDSKCYNGGGHLLNVGNLSRLLIGEFMEYEKLVYLDSDSIVQYDIIEKIKFATLSFDLYADCANKIHSNNKKQIVIKMSNILKYCDWKTLIGYEINMNEYVYMGAPFITNCKKWKDVYPSIIKIMKLHNDTPNGIYKLFTMSLQNIFFYKKTGNIRDIMNVLQDLGSDRKQWDKEDLYNQDVLDWSGVYKPWFSNGLYRELWLYYDIMKLSPQYGTIHKDKTQIEKFKLPNI